MNEVPVLTHSKELSNVIIISYHSIIIIIMQIIYNIIIHFIC